MTLTLEPTLPITVEAHKNKQPGISRAFLSWGTIEFGYDGQVYWARVWGAKPESDKGADTTLEALNNHIDKSK